MSIVFTEFMANNPTYFITKAEAVKSDEMGLDFGHEKVREEYLNVIKDLGRNYSEYPLAALELNFIRGKAYFKPQRVCVRAGGCVSLEQRRKIMTEFLHTVKAELAPETVLIVKGPQLLDATQNGWHSRGFFMSDLDGIVDAIVLSPWLVNYPVTGESLYDSHLAQARQQAPNVALYQDIHFAWDRDLDRPRHFRRITDEQLYHMANWAYENGADGLGLYNFQYFRQSQRNSSRDERNIPFYTFKHPNDPNWLQVHTEQSFHSRSDARHIHAHGDFNGNGTTDIAFVVKTQAEKLQIRLIQSGAKGVWSREKIQNLPWQADMMKEPIHTGDFDGDGIDDIAFVSERPFPSKSPATIESR